MKKHNVLLICSIFLITTSIDAYYSQEKALETYHRILSPETKLFLTEHNVPEPNTHENYQACIKEYETLTKFKEQSELGPTAEKTKRCLEIFLGTFTELPLPKFTHYDTPTTLQQKPRPLSQHRTNSQRPSNRSKILQEIPAPSLRKKKREQEEKIAKLQKVQLKKI